MPYVPARGQGGAGEILSLSHVFLHAAAQWPLAEKDMLALVNGSPARFGIDCRCGTCRLTRLQVAVEVFALAAEAFNTPHGHFAAELGRLLEQPA